jgi:hypothetical protein
MAMKPATDNCLSCGFLYLGLGQDRTRWWGIQQKYFAAQWLRRWALTPYPNCSGRASFVLRIKISFGRINGDAAAEE